MRTIFFYATSKLFNRTKSIYRAESETRLKPSYKKRVKTSNSGINWETGSRQKSDRNRPLWGDDRLKFYWTKKQNKKKKKRRRRRRKKTKKYKKDNIHPVLYFAFSKFVTVHSYREYSTFCANQGALFFPRFRRVEEQYALCLLLGLFTWRLRTSLCTFIRAFQISARFFRKMAERCQRKRERLRYDRKGNVESYIKKNSST